MSQIFGGFTDTDSGGDVDGPASATNNDIAAFDGTTGKLIKDSGILYTSVVVGPASATDDALARFDATTGKLIQNSGATYTDAGLLTVVAASMTTGLQGAGGGTTAGSGYVGETSTITRQANNALSVTSNTALNVCTQPSITVPAGDWLISGSIGYQAAASTSITDMNVSVSKTSATISDGATTSNVPVAGEILITWKLQASVPGSGAVTTLNIPAFRAQFATPTIIFLVGKATFTVSTLTCFGFLQVSRFR